MHGFEQAGIWLPLSLLSVIASMSFWFRDVISEGTAKCLQLYLRNLHFILKTVKAIAIEEIKQCLADFYLKCNKRINHYENNEDFGYYLGGLLEGDGHISLPSLGVTKLNRVLNPRIVFTSHINNLGLYAYIQEQLGGIGRFQHSGKNVVRYIIGDVKGIILIIRLISGKLRTPKNQRLNHLITFMNNKYELMLPSSDLDVSKFDSNSWFTGFTEADGHFGVKVIEAKPKSNTRKRSVSTNISLVFRLDQRSYDKPNNTSMLPVMQMIASFLSCNLACYLRKSPSTEALSVSVASLEKIGFLIDYFNKYPLIGVKSKEFDYWVEVYNMMIIKEHLTEEGRSKIRSISALLKSLRK